MKLSRQLGNNAYLYWAYQGSNQGTWFRISPYRCMQVELRSGEVTTVELRGSIVRSAAETGSSQLPKFPVAEEDAPAI
jgi:hypothetical protein